MLRTLLGACAILAASCASAPPTIRSPSEGVEGWRPIRSGIEYRLLRRTEPRPLRAHIVRADLEAGGLVVRTPAGADPDGDGPAEAALADPLALARASGAFVLVNASSFAVIGYAEGCRPAVYRRGMGVDISGLSVDAGRIVSPPNGRYAAVYVDDAGRPGFSASGSDGSSDPPSAAAAGFAPLVVRGTITEVRDGAREPRTAVGSDGAGRLILVVVEGRRPGASAGLSLAELASLMADLGCLDALNLDGGGSSVLVIRPPGRGPQALTPPLDGFGPFRRRRPIPNALILAEADPD